MNIIYIPLKNQKNDLFIKLLYTYNAQSCKLNRELRTWKCLKISNEIYAEVNIVSKSKDDDKSNINVDDFLEEVDKMNSEKLNYNNENFIRFKASNFIYS